MAPVSSEALFWPLTCEHLSIQWQTERPKANTHRSIFNRETREDGGMPPHERSYLNDTFMHTGLGIGIIGLAARTLHGNGWSFRLMSANPWLVFGVGLVGSIGTMWGCMATPPDK